MAALYSYYQKLKDQLLSLIPVGIRQTLGDYKDILFFLFLLFLSQTLFEMAYNPVRNNSQKTVIQSSQAKNNIPASVVQSEEKKSVPVIHLLKQYTGPLFSIKDSLEAFEASVFARGASYIGRCVPGYEDIRWEGRSVTYPEGKNFTKLYINDSCNGNKIYYQFLFILLFYWGPLRKKYWYIPLGVSILVLINVLRMSMLYYVGGEYPSQFDFWHEQGGRAIMYPSIFLLWLYWEIKINRPYQAKKKIQASGSSSIC